MLYKDEVILIVSREKIHHLAKEVNAKPHLRDTDVTFALSTVSLFLLLLYYIFNKKISFQKISTQVKTQICITKKKPPFYKITTIILNGIQFLLSYIFLSLAVFNLK